MYILRLWILALFRDEEDDDSWLPSLVQRRHSLLLVDALILCSSVCWMTAMIMSVVRPPYG